ncbi:unnamed protein product, partial [Prorocentrum cordatum]
DGAEAEADGAEDGQEKQEEEEEGSVVERPRGTFLFTPSDGPQMSVKCMRRDTEKISTVQCRLGWSGPKWLQMVQIMDKSWSIEDLRRAFQDSPKALSQALMDETLQRIVSQGVSSKAAAAMIREEVMRDWKG